MSFPQENVSDPDESSANEDQASYTIRPQGRPRDENVKLRILSCALQQARSAKSFQEITITGLAKAAQTTKATIYRWWKTKSDVLYEACFAGQMQDPCQNTLADDLDSLIEQSYRMYTERVSRGVIGGMLVVYIEQSERDGLRAGTPVFPHEFVRDDILATIFKRAAARSEAPATVNLRAMSQVIGARMFMGCVVHRVQWSETHGKNLRELVLAAASADLQPKGSSELS